MTIKKPPYALHHTDLIFDQATELRFLRGELQPRENCKELGNEKFGNLARARVLDAAAMLFIKHIGKPAHQEEPGRLLAMCLDTALIWERG
jgi:hypothetical protein